MKTAFERTVDEGQTRLHRTLPGLLATGALGGIDVGIGLFAFFVILEETDQPLVAALGFSIGFIALTLAQSELFTENFLVPVAAVAARKARVSQVFRLWAGTMLTNLIGGWLIMAIALASLPKIKATAVEAGRHFIDMGITWEAFASAVMGGAVITLMTWMERGTSSTVGKLVAAISAGFLLSAAVLNHAIVRSLEMFAALEVGAPFGYLDWLGSFAWASLGNIVGGIGLVTMLRLVQVGSEKVDQERDRPKEESRADSDKEEAST
ncbi:MAG: formate/nitrite transporter family protein [Actinomycetota bacterium]